MQKTTRSPRFPFIPLQRALKHTRTLHEQFNTTATPAPKAMKALGLDTMSGKANKVIAALRAYGLITVEKDKVRKIAVTPPGARLSKNPAAPNCLNPLRLAALAPMPFRRLWYNRPGVTEEQLAELFQKRQFTEQGAQRAARIYMANVRFAQLEDPGFRASNNVPPAKLPPKAPAAANVRPAGRGAASLPTDGPRRLQVPLGDSFAAIPVGISQDDFKLLMQTLRLWKSTLVSA
jgi:hypothetical protein